MILTACAKRGVIRDDLSAQMEKDYPVLEESQEEGGNVQVMPEQVVEPETYPKVEIITQGESEEVRKGEDIDEEREKALERAKDEAILQSAGNYVNPELLVKERENLLKIFEPRRDEIIGHYRVVSEYKDKDGFYTVKISAKIREDLVKTLLMENLYDNRVIVVTSEKNMGNLMDRHILEQELISRVKEKGYEIMDFRTMNHDKVKKLVASIREGNTESVKKLGLYCLTDIVIVGYVESEFSEVTREIYSAHASGQVKIHLIGSSKELLSLTKHSVKGFGSDEQKAGLDALRKIAPEIAGEAVQILPEILTRNVTLMITQIGNYFNYRKAREMISRIPYVDEVTEGTQDFGAEEVTLYLRTTKDVDYIAGKISELKKFVIKGITNGGIVLESRKI